MRPKERVIYHIDCNSFFASVECLERPELREVPMAVAGDPEKRHGIILAKNEKAKRYGIQTAEPIPQALRKCPSLVLVPPRHHRYTEVSAQVKRIFGDYTDQVESFGLDEAWLDVTGSLRYFRSTPVQLADAIRERVKREVGITVSVGVSFTKTFAKLGSDMKKPDGTTLISRANYRRLVWPLPAEALLFVGKNASEALSRHCIFTIGDIAGSDPAFLEQALGKGSASLWRYANGLDDAPVRHPWEREPVKSMGNGMTFRRDLQGWEALKSAVIALSDEVSARLRKEGMKCASVQVMVRSPNLKTITRQGPLPWPTHLQQEIVEAAMGLLHVHWREDAPVRALCITAQNLCRDESAADQMCLWSANQSRLCKLERAESAMRRLRERYGRDCLAMGYVQNEDMGTVDFSKGVFTHDG